MITVQENTQGKLIALSVKGKLTENDYDKIMPLIDKTVREYGSVRLLLNIENLGGMEPKAFLADWKTYFKHHKHFEKIAVVGHSKWYKMWSNLASPFVSGEIKYFTDEQLIAAKEWVLI